MSETERYIASIHVWHQTSADYDAERKLHTKMVSPETTVLEIMRWAKWKCLGAGDVVLTVNEED